MRALVPPHLRSWERAGAGPAPSTRQPEESFDFAGDPPRPRSQDEEPKATNPHATRRSSLPCPPPQYSASDGGGGARHVDAENQRMLEGPPLEDFEWSEKDSPYAQGLSPDALEGSIDDTP